MNCYPSKPTRCSLLLATACLLVLLTCNAQAVPGYDYRTGYGRISLDADVDGFNHDDDNCDLIYNTDQTDTDGDLAGNACDSDDDNDGLSDVDESGYGTDPLLADTDTDGLIDGEEVNTYSTDPLASDTDTDGLNDGDEVSLYATDPLLVDSDGDGAQDNLEVDSSTDPLLASEFPTTPDGDVSGDGVVNIKDVLIGYRLLTSQMIPSEYQSAHADAAPLISGIPSPNGVFDAGDMYLIYSKSMGLISF